MAESIPFNGFDPRNKVHNEVPKGYMTVVEAAETFNFNKSSIANTAKIGGFAHAIKVRGPGRAGYKWAISVQDLIECRQGLRKLVHPQTSKTAKPGQGGSRVTSDGRDVDRIPDLSKKELTARLMDAEYFIEKTMTEYNKLLIHLRHLTNAFASLCEELGTSEHAELLDFAGLKDCRALSKGTNSGQ